MAKNFADGQERNSKRVLRMANNLMLASWEIKLSEELNKIKLGYIWHDSKENSIGYAKNKRKMQ
jgi:hypothetical protein